MEKQKNIIIASIIFASVDGFDFKVQDPTKFDPKYYSHKFKSAGLRYEIGGCIGSEKIVTADGPSKSGMWTDLKINQSELKWKLDDNEFIIADLGYRDYSVVLLGTQTTNNGILLHRRIRARHETLNGLLKNFVVLRQSFRHRIDFHCECFFAVLNVQEGFTLSTPFIPQVEEIAYVGKARYHISRFYFRQVK